MNRMRYILPVASVGAEPFAHAKVPPSSVQVTEPTAEVVISKQTSQRPVGTFENVITFASVSAIVKAKLTAFKSFTSQAYVSEPAPEPATVV